MKTTPLTTKQTLVLAFIREFKQQKDYSPSSREIADNFGVVQNAAMNYLRTLRQKGFITWVAGQPRAIALVPKAEGSAQ